MRDAAPPSNGGHGVPTSLDADPDLYLGTLLIVGAVPHLAPGALDTALPWLTQHRPLVLGCAEQREHIWLADLDFGGAKPSGVIANAPHLTSLMFMQRVEFEPSYISDWMYVEDGYLVGGYTTCVIRARMTPEERREHDSSHPTSFHRRPNSNRTRHVLATNPLLICDIFECRDGRQSGGTPGSTSSSSSAGRREIVLERASKCSWSKRGRQRYGVTQE